MARLPTNKRNAPKQSILGLVYQIQQTRHEQGLRETYRWYQQQDRPEPDYSWEDRLLVSAR